ncbi:hypothetical protein T190607A01A_60002 [Tenacibaculum sp. 190524A05c]|uniref:Uncharacterized protein n=1 Tax=Tenacibaculum platacis TaxID=3137852 RepID=A0ABP1ETL2_9FLAO
MFSFFLEENRNNSAPVFMSSTLGSITTYTFKIQKVFFRLLVEALYKLNKERLCSTYKLSKLTYAQHYSKNEISISKIIINPHIYFCISVKC